MQEMSEERANEAIAADDRTRRELLWLRAKEKGDEVVAHELERTDPRIVARLRCAGLDIEERDGESAQARCERFGALWDRCYLRYVASLLRR